MLVLNLNMSDALPGACDDRVGDARRGIGASASG